jgi:ABC-type uncharacterized transport system ATPase subunit
MATTKKARGATTAKSKRRPARRPRVTMIQGIFERIESSTAEKNLLVTRLLAELDSELRAAQAKVETAQAELACALNVHRKLSSMSVEHLADHMIRLARIFS